MKVLIVEDSEDDALLLVRYLKEHGLDPVTRRVASIASLRSALRAFQWDVILCDVSMPDLDALGALAEVKSTGIDIPFIVVSGTVPEECLVDLMKAGAHDVVVKDRLSRLAPAIEREISEAAVRRERRQIESQLQVAIESIAEGFALYDAEDRLVLCNETYKTMYSKSADAIVSGATFEDILRDCAERGQYERALGGVEEFVRERMVRHRTCGDPFEQKLSDGRWILVDERRTRDGGTVGIRTDITALKTAEQELRDNEALLRLIVDNLPIVVTYLDSELRYRLVNKTVGLWYGRAESEIIGRSAAEILGPASYNNLEPHLDRAANGASELFEATVTYPDGVTREIYAVYVSDRDDKGLVRGFVAMAIDITDRHRTERALRDREEFIRLVVDNVADAVITINESCLIESFNGSAEQLFGYSASEVRGRNVAMLMPEPYRSRHDGFVANYLQTGQGAILGMGSREVVGLRKDGSTFPLELSIGEACPAGRRIFVGTIRDLSARKNAELAIRESEERFRVAFETAPHGIALIGLDGRWLKVNRAVTKTLGYDEDELLGADVQIVMHPDDLAADQDLIHQMLGGGISSYQMEKRYIRRDGQVVDALLSKALVRDADGAPAHFVAQFLDLTERKETEAQLLQAQKMEAVGQLTGGIAHDFNNLLTVIMGNARLLERHLAKGDAVVAKNLDAIISAARRSTKLTQRLLAFSRKERLEPKVVDGRELVSGMVDMMRRTLGETIRIKARFADGPLNLVTDANLLEAALLNLATNARDAMPEGGTLTISLRSAQDEEGNCRPEPQMAPDEYIVLSVSDTGTGIPEEHREKIFEPFFTTKRVGKGTGLGLSMVFGFVKQSGGHIGVSSEVGCGTTFRLYLPAANAVHAMGAEGAARAAQQPGGGETILVVEDETEVREIAVSILNDLGYRVIEAKDGPDALAKLKEQPGVDLLFTDMIMPGGMTGHELAEQAKDQWPGLKVLYTSGYTDDALASAGKDIRLVRKPYDDTVLAKEIKEALCA